MRSVMKNLKQLLMKKEKHDRMKEGIRNIKIVMKKMNYVKTVKIIERILKLHNFNRETFFFYGVEVIADKNGKLWLNEGDI